MSSRAHNLRRSDTHHHHHPLQARSIMLPSQGSHSWHLSFDASPPSSEDGVFRMKISSQQAFTPYMPQRLTLHLNPEVLTRKAYRAPGLTQRHRLSFPWLHLPYWGVGTHHSLTACCLRVCALAGPCALTGACCLCLSSPSKAETFPPPSAALSIVPVCPMSLTTI